MFLACEYFFSDGQEQFPKCLKHWVRINRLVQCSVCPRSDRARRATWGSHYKCRASAFLLSLHQEEEEISLLCAPTLSVPSSINSSHCAVAVW